MVGIQCSAYNNNDNNTDGMIMVIIVPSIL